MENEEEEDDDTEGLPLWYGPHVDSPFGSPLSSPTPSPLSSLPPSPSSTRPSSPLTVPGSPLLPSDGIAPIIPPPIDMPRVEKRPITHKQAGAKKRRQRKREAKKHSESPKIRLSQSKRYEDLKFIKNTFNARVLPVTKTGFIGKRFDVVAEHRPLASYVKEGFKVVEWDGK